MAAALGELHWSVPQLMAARLSHLIIALQGHRDEREREYRRHAELVRLQTVELINIQISKNKLRRASALWPFPWDADVVPAPTDAPQPTPEQNIENINRLLKAFDQ